MTSLEKPSIAIIGGGLGGLTLSIGLSLHGIPHTIYESAAAFSEIGAGIALCPNSIAALELIDPRIKKALEKCVTYNDGIVMNGDKKGKEEWMDVRVGEERDFNTLITTICHTGSPRPVRASVHRAKFLNELIKLIPPSTAQFRKNLTLISKDLSTDNLSLSFADDSTATASAVIACDGIKSVVRQNYVLSEVPNQQLCRPSFVHEFGYRGMFPREEFLKITSNTIDPGKGTVFCGQNGYVVTYPVEKGSLINVMAMKHISSSAADTDYAALQDESNWIQPVTDETVLADFEAWGASLKGLLSRIQRPERWALYDHLPAPTYVKGRVALLGDAAHATTPHQGQGAGMAFEDSLVLSGILGRILNEPFPTSVEDGGQEAVGLATNVRVESCLRAYDEVRRPRTQKVTRTSRESGEILSFLGDGIGRDCEKMKENLDTRMHWIWDVDLSGEVDRGVQIARREMSGTS